MLRPSVSFHREGNLLRSRSSDQKSVQKGGHEKGGGGTARYGLLPLYFLMKRSLWTREQSHIVKARK